MICLLVLTAHEGLLEAEIRDDETGEFERLKGVPRGLLPSGVAEKKIIDIWWDSVSKRHIFEKGAPSVSPSIPARCPRSVQRRQRTSDPWSGSLTVTHAVVPGSAVYLITNANKYKYYERWATAHDFPM